MKIAVIGGGISGLVASYLLRDYDLHLFEKNDRLGGHAKTVFPASDLPIDIGFLVYNTLTYPGLTKLFDILGVETVESDMSLSVQIPQDDLEWAGTNYNTLWGQRRNFFRPSFYGFLKDILKFHKNAQKYLAEVTKSGETLKDLLDREGFKDSFVEWYILPMAAAIWSSPERTMGDYPAKSFLEFCINHRLLQVNGRPIWRTVKNGSINYVDKISKFIPNIHLSSDIKSITSNDETQLVDVFVDGEKKSFDRVIMATHAPITFKLLKNKTAKQEEILGHFDHIRNELQLHQNASVMPKRKRIWSSWNAKSALDKNESVFLSYYCNLLQPLKTKEDFFITLNSKERFSCSVYEQTFFHPLFDKKAVDSQKLIKDIQGDRGIFIAGAWTGYGFHEDGLKSAVEVARFFDKADPCFF